ncbi:MAG: hypothetical protein IRY85_10090 [Micromonosporaceae bacterium]|nr:hypothetical protein [Micromonosporaceae bacterium]
MSKIAKFRKKPVEIEAAQLTEDADWEAVAAWCGGRLANVEQADSGEYETTLVISTLEGDMTACVGDWVIRGVKGEFYPCRDDIFRATYEPVTAQEMSDGAR